MKQIDFIEILGNGNQINITYGEDLAEGIGLLLSIKMQKMRILILSTSQSTTVLELAEIIWKKIKPDQEFKYTSTDSFEFDVQEKNSINRKSKKFVKLRSSNYLTKC